MIQCSLRTSHTSLVLVQSAESSLVLLYLFHFDDTGFLFSLSVPPCDHPALCQCNLNRYTSAHIVLFLTPGGTDEKTPPMQELGATPEVVDGHHGVSS